LKVTREKVENSQAYLTVEMEPADMEAPMQDAYKQLARKTNIPGFRKGKAPRSVVERYLGRESILEEAMKNVVPQAYEQALKEQEIEPFAQPDLEITGTDPVTFKAVVPLAPTVELGEYKTISMKPDPVKITDDNIDKVIEELRHQHTTWEPVDRPLEYNDLAVIDIKGIVDEKPYVQKVGAQMQIVKDLISPAPGFSEQVVGMKKDGAREFKLTFPEDYPNSQVAGKEAAFTVKLSEVKEEKLPELDDSFVAQISSELKTVDALREEVRKSLTLQAEERSRMDFEERVIDAAIELSTVAYPPVLVEMEINRILNEQARQLQMTGRGMDEYLQSINKSADQLREDLRPVASKNVAASLVMARVAEAEKIEVTEEDINNSIDNMTRGAAEDRVAELRKMLDTPQTRESLEQSLKTRKTIERLTELAKSSKPVKKKAKEEVK